MKKIISISILLFLVFIINISFADIFDDIEGGDEDLKEYTIMDYKDSISNGNYNASENIGIDYICTSSQLADVSPCDRITDPTIRVYPAWKILRKVEPYLSNPSSYEIESFSSKNQIFRQGSFEWYKPDESILELDDLINSIVSVTDFNKESYRNIDYVMTYLHKTNYKIELFENTRESNYYSSQEDFLSNELMFGNEREKARYSLIRNNGEFYAPSTILTYSTVPHVLGYEGSEEMYTFNNGGEKGIVAAVMDESNGIPVPVILNKGNTGFFRLKEKDLDIDNIKNKYAPGYNKELESNITGLKSPDEIKEFKNSDGEEVYGSFIATDSKNKKYSIDNVYKLRELIQEMKGPQYVGSIDIAMSEAITQRNSTYQFMSSMPNNGMYVYNTMAGNTSNGNAPAYYGVMDLKPKNIPLYMYANNEIEPISVNLTKLTQTNNPNNLKASTLTSGVRKNANFKISTLGIIRGYVGEDDYNQIYNYHNEIEPYIFETTTVKNGIEKNENYFGFKLVPKNSDNTNSNGSSTINTGKLSTDTWGTWRQIGWGQKNDEVGSFFPHDVSPFPINKILYDWSDNSTACYNSSSVNCGPDILRFPWKSHNSDYKIDATSNITFLNEYIEKSNTGKIENKSIEYNKMYTTFVNYVKTRPDILYRLFYMAEDMNNNSLDSLERDSTYRAIGDEKLRSIGQKICENLTGNPCSNDLNSFYSAIYDGTNSEFGTSFLALLDAFNYDEDGNSNTTYGEDLAYILYNYFALVDYADEFTMGNLFYLRRPDGGNYGAYYSYSRVLSIDESDIFILNEEDRLGNEIFGNSENGKATGTEVKYIDKDEEGNIIVSSIGEKKGTEIYLINPITGEKYSAADNDVTCPESYIQEGEFCKKTEETPINKTCSNGYTFDEESLKCIEVGAGNSYCPAGYYLSSNKCERYTGTTPICENGVWDEENKKCLEVGGIKCPTGYIVKDLNENNKLNISGSWEFKSTSSDFNAFSPIGANNYRQIDGENIGYIFANTTNGIQRNNININSNSFSYIQLKFNNNSDSKIGYIQYKTNLSSSYNSQKEVSFNMNKGENIVIIELNGSNWNGNITGLRFLFSKNIGFGDISIDYIKYGNKKSNYIPELKCVKEVEPVCPNGTTIVEDKCAGYLSSFTSLPNSYDLTCEHVNLKSDEKVTLSTFRIGDYLDISQSESGKIFTAPVDGDYYFEAWAASNSSTKGGYTAGLKTLNKGESVSLKVGLQNSDTETSVSLENGTKIIVANNGTGSTNGVKSSYRLIKSPSNWFKKFSDTGTNWTGENGHSGNGHIRITLFESHNQRLTVENKVKEISGSGNNNYSYNGSYHTFTAPATGTYTFQLWGAQGGGRRSDSSLGGLGGYVKGDIVLNENQTVYLYIGGKGGNSPSNGIDGSSSTNNNGGYNGGGNGAGSRGPGGGGRTDVRTSTSYSSELLVAAGGGGNAANNKVLASTSKSSGIRYRGENGRAGSWGSYERDTAGGGGGYYGGEARDGDDVSSSYAGTNYTGSSTNSYSQYGVNSNHGRITITYNINVEESLGYLLKTPNNTKELGICLISKKTTTINSTDLKANLSEGKILDKNGNIENNQNQEKNYYSSTVSSYIIPQNGEYKIEVWGAQGGVGSTDRLNRGAYASGTSNFNAGDVLRIYVGRQGNSTGTNSIDGHTSVVRGGYNGGGNGTGSAGPGGGGATDVRLNSTSIHNRIIVAGGGGGNSTSTTSAAGRGITNSSTHQLFQGWSATPQYFGQWPGDMGGGGGGYYGGGGRTGDDARWSYGGTSYVSPTFREITVKDGNSTMPGTHNGTMIGKSGNGYAVITNLNSISSTIKSDEPKLLISPTCQSGLIFDINSGKCLAETEMKCNTGYTFNPENENCEKFTKPNYCSNDGELYYDAPGWGCKIVTSITCDSGYSVVNNVCTKNNLGSYEPKLCLNGYQLNEGKCSREFLIPISEFSGESLEGNQMTVEIGKLYMSRNYIGYKVSKNRGSLLEFIVEDENNNYSYVRSAKFPNVSMNLTLVDKAIASTSICSTEDGDHCESIPNDIKTFKINTDGNGEEISLFYGHKLNNNYLSNLPDCDINFVSSEGRNTPACRYMWSEFNPTNRNLILNSDYNALFSAVDSYFMFKEDEFCYANSTPFDKVTQSSLTCVPYESNSDFTINDNGVNKLNLIDDNGDEKINSLFINSEIEGYKKDLSIDINNAYKMVDNNIYTNDKASLITGFKLAPDSDIFIDRFEVFEADTNESVFVVEAMTKERCLNGYEIETGITALYTQTFKDESYDNGIDRDNKLNCSRFDPSTSVIQLDRSKNYYAKVYTKYNSLNETSINLNEEAMIETIELDLNHTGNFGALGVYNDISNSLANADKSSNYLVESGKFDNVGNNLELNPIYHNNIIEFDITRGLIDEEVNGRYNLNSSTLTSINEHFRPNNYNLTVSDPRNAFIIPAEGLSQKGYRNGVLNVSIGGETLLRDAYNTWNTLQFRYDLGDGLDIESYPILRCGTEILQVKDGTCVYVNSSIHTNCKLYAVAELVSGEGEVSSNIRVDWTNNVNDRLDASNGNLYISTEKINNLNPRVEIFIRNVNSSEGALYAETLHNSEDNDGYVDTNWSNNLNNNCWLFNPVDYSITDVQITENEMIEPNLDANDSPIRNNKVVTFKGNYDITKIYDKGSNKNVPITYKLVESYNVETGTHGRQYSCTSTNPNAKVLNVKEGDKLENIPFDITCNVNFGVLNPGDNLALVVGINGGFNGSRTFNETDYSNNESVATIFTRDVPTEFTCILNQCVTENRWVTNFDFVYQFDRNIRTYETNNVTNFGWTDYKVGTVSGSTNDLEYDRPIGSGNINRAPDDYMAYRSHTSSTNSLCTDYRAGFNNCWRYENNVNHTVDYYRYSTAITSVYSTHRVLNSPSGTCSQETYSAYGNQNAGTSGSQHNFANSTTSSGTIGGCHGFTGAPVNNSCSTISSWFGNTICQSSPQVYDVSAYGRVPGNFIGAANFLDKTISDASAFSGAITSPTTKTDRIVLKSQINYTNNNQGSLHSGWVKSRTADACTLIVPKNVSFNCPSGYTYGTIGGRSAGAKTKGLSSCPAAGYGTSSRTCSWNSSSTSPTTSNYYPAVVNNTCFREHYDWRCSSYQGVSPNQTYLYESSAGARCQYSTRSSSFWTAGSSSCNYYEYKRDPSCGSYCPRAKVCENEVKSCTYCRVGRVNGICPEPTDNCYLGLVSTICEGGMVCPVEEIDNYCNVSMPGTYNYKSCNGVWSGYSSTSCQKNPPQASTPTCTTSNTVNRTKSCSPGDLDDGGNVCYQVGNEYLVTSNNVCAQWNTISYNEVQYYTTESPRETFISRTYHKPTNIWQYTVDTTTPSVPYPSNSSFKMDYRERVTMQTEIKTERSGDWIVLSSSNNAKDANPRGGEWFEIRTTVEYSTNRGTKPSQMPYLTDYYNNYHNLNLPNRFDAPQNDTLYPPTNYPHLGQANSIEVSGPVSGPYHKATISNFRDIVNNSDYGYADVRPAEPYGCDYDGFQFANIKQNNVNITQGHNGAQWTSNLGGDGLCYFGPDNKTVWKKEIFGSPRDYSVITEICPSNEPDCNRDNSLISSKMEAVNHSCTSFVNGLCVRYRALWMPAAQRDANGAIRRGFYIPTDFEAQTANIEVSTSWFNAVGQYEKTLIGDNDTTYGAEKFFIEEPGNPIKPICSCNSYEVILKDGEHGWATSEWDVE